MRENKMNKTSLKVDAAKHSTLFAVSLILFSLADTYNLGLTSYIGISLMAVYATVMILYVVLYGFCLMRHSDSRLLYAAFSVTSLMFLAACFLYIRSGQFSLSFLFLIENVLAYAGLLMILMFIANVIIYAERKYLKAVMVLVIASIVILVYGTSLIQYQLNDEVLIGYYGAHNLLDGINPYTHPINSLLDSYGRSIGSFVTLNNSILGKSDYPAGYFLILTPFYLLYHGGASRITGAYMHSQMVVFFLILLLSLGLVTKKGELFRPNYLAYLAFGFVSLWNDSTMTFIMVALMLMLYTDIGNRYPWIFLGLAAALQEELWIMVLLFMAYYLNNYGLRKGMHIAVGTFAIFLAISGYFIILSPSGYFGSILGSSAIQLPGSYAAVGYFLSILYPINVHAYSILFGIAILLVVLASLYINKKGLIPILAMIPFLFLFSSMVYFILPIFIFTIVCNVPIHDDNGDLFGRAIRSNSRYALGAVFGVSVAILASFAFVEVSHLGYINEFNVNLSNQTVSASMNSMVYRADLSFSGAGNDSAYLIVEVSGDGGSYLFGLYNQSIINNSLKCGYPCSINVNLIQLNDTKRVEATMPAISSPGSSTYISAIIYNSNHYYKSRPLRLGATA